MSILVYGLAFGLAWVGISLVRLSSALDVPATECHPGVARLLGGMAVTCAALLPWCVR